MAIGTAVQKGPTVYVYDEKGRQIALIPANNGTLQGYTTSSVSVRRDRTIYVYDEKGQQISLIPV